MSSADKFTTLFKQWFSKLDQETKYSYYHGTCTVIDSLDYDFMRESKIKIDDYILLIDETDRHRDHCLMYYIREYVLHVFNTPIPKKGGRKKFIPKKMLEKITEEDDEEECNIVFE